MKYKHSKNNVPNWMLCVFYAVLEWFLLFYILEDTEVTIRQIFPAIETFLFLVATLLLCYGLCNKLRTALTIHILLVSLFGFIQFFAIQLRGSIFYFSDIYNIKTALNVAENYTLDLTSRFWVGLFYVIFLLIGTRYAYHYRMRKKGVRLRITLIGFILTVSSIFLIHVTEEVYGYNNYFKGWYLNGYIYEFIGTMNVHLEIPEEYVREEYVDMDKTYYDGIENKPNVIFVMSESLMDIETYDFNLPHDIQPFMHELMDSDDCISGTLYSSVLGGMTACMEFEAITGHSSYFTGSVVQYTAYMKDGERYGSVTDVFHDLGYHTTAFHPYLKNGYNRPCAYKALGFDDYIGMEDLNDFENGTNIPGRNTFVSDEYNYDKLFDIMKDTAEEDFILNVTMQNHGGYEEPELTDVDKPYDMGIDGMNNYLYLLKLSDEALKNFISQLKNFDEPTIIVFFGDHQPKEIESLNISDELIKYQTPYFIWANFKLNTDVEHTEYTSANYLAPLMFEAIWGKQPNGWYSYLEELRQQYPVISQNVIMNYKGEFVNPDLSEYEKKAYYAVWEQN